MSHMSNANYMQFGIYYFKIVEKELQRNIQKVNLLSIGEHDYR